MTPGKGVVLLAWYEKGMARTRQNPRGLPVLQEGATIVRVGRHGKHTHLYSPVTGMHACKSGINAGRGGPSGAMPELYETDATEITCYRCAKLAHMNTQRFGSPVPQAS